MLAIRYSLCEIRSEKIVTAAIPGPERRSTIRQNAPIRDEPSTCAASSNSRGIASKKALNIQVANGRWTTE